MQCIPFLFYSFLKNQEIKKGSQFANLFLYIMYKDYFATAYLLATSVQLITLKKASI
jgi:hypothetical protein